MSLRTKHIVWVAGALAVVLFFVSSLPPAGFPVGSIFVIKKGQSMGEIARQLKEESYIQSTYLFRGFVLVFGGNVKSGSYEFDNTTSLFEVAFRIARGDFRLQPIKIVLPEGGTIVELKTTLKKSLKDFNEKAFDAETVGKEGYLFPETYHVLPDEDGLALVRTMEETFTDAIKKIEDEILAFGRPLEDVITMASILEEEARSMDVRRTIAGILWKRMKHGMPLQVDSSLTYTTGRNTFELTKKDLIAADPYNTYKHKGLPPTPISNPGIAAIKAAITPIDTPYWYFLTGHDGVMRYGKTFEEHKINRAKYLD